MSLVSRTNYLLHDTCHANCTICLHLWQKRSNHLQLVFHFVCIIVLFDAFNKTQSGEVAGNIFSRLMKYFCVVMFRVAALWTARTRLSFRRLILLGSLMTAAIATARGKHTKSETSHLKTHPEQWEKGVAEFTN